MGAIPSPRPRDLRTRPWPSFLRSGRTRLRERRSSRRAPQASRPMGVPLRRAERRGRPPEARIMTKKASGDIVLWRRGRRLRERHGWRQCCASRTLGRWPIRLTRTSKRCAQPSATIKPLRNCWTPTRTACSPQCLRSGTGFEIYDELVKFEEEEPGPLLSPLTAIVADNSELPRGPQCGCRRDWRGSRNQRRRGVAEDSRIRRYGAVSA